MFIAIDYTAPSSLFSNWAKLSHLPLLRGKRISLYWGHHTFWGAAFSNGADMSSFRAVQSLNSANMDSPQRKANRNGCIKNMARSAASGYRWLKIGGYPFRMWNCGYYYFGKESPSVGGRTAIKSRLSFYFKINRAHSLPPPILLPQRPATLVSVVALDFFHCKIFFVKMPMLYKQAAQKQKPALLAPPNVFLQDAFTRYYFPLSVSNLIIVARTLRSPSLPGSIVLKLGRNWFILILTMRWRSSSRAILPPWIMVDVLRGIWNLGWNRIHRYGQAWRRFLLSKRCAY